MVQIRKIPKKNRLEKFYEIIGCRSIDIVDLVLGDKVYSVICDDEFLYRNPLIPTLYIPNRNVIYGPVIIGKTTLEGDTVGLTSDDIIRLDKYLKKQFPMLREMVNRITGKSEITEAVYEAMNIVNEAWNK